MRRRIASFLRSLVYIAILLFLLSPSVKGEIINRVVAIVNEEIITLSEFLKIAQTQSPEAASTFSTEKYRELLNRIIDQKLVDQEALKTETNISDREVDEAIERLKQRNGLSTEQFNEALQQQGLTWDEYREKMREEMKRSQFIAQKIQSQVNISEKEMKNYFRKHRKDYFEPARVKIEQVFFPFPSNATPETKNSLAVKAEEALKRIKAGEDFHNIAQEFNLTEEKSSYDPGYFKKGELMAALDETAFSLNIGELSNVITTTKGYVIIRVLERTEDKSKTLDEVREEITNSLFQKKMEKKFQEWMEELHGKAYIEIKI